MDWIKTPIEGLFVIEPKVFGDCRGYFFESFSVKKFNEILGKNTPNFVQDNESMSRCGSVLDVAVDLRKNSPTYGKHFSVLLSGENKKQFFIPKGFAHGFSVLEDDTIFAYKVTDFYHPEAEQSILFDDSTLAIDWGLQSGDYNISEKDRKGIAFNDFISPF